MGVANYCILIGVYCKIKELFKKVGHLVGCIGFWLVPIPILRFGGQSRWHIAVRGERDGTVVVDSLGTVSDT